MKLDEITIEEYFDELETHDWFYEMSSDPNAFADGKRNLNRLHNIAMSKPAFSRMFADYSKYMSNRFRSDKKFPKPKLEDYVEDV